ncbi:640_t:CDS:2 [Ambispora gerdemannii]|uniref:640_t:CDS:1 n=1 Tax=Ambispora gerdemannii TaxID=144530 RepID=A0A9N8Z777_9GLOM|nr:640_t:CDS:2 [Ambispora gerdemannii]
MDQYTPGTVVYAKLKGYPWWPARIELEASLPSTVVTKKPKGPRPVWGVRFFGSRDYGWFGKNDLKPFDNNAALELLEKLKGKKRDKPLEKAIREALNPSSLDEPEKKDDEKDDDTEKGSPEDRANEEEETHKKMPDKASENNGITSTITSKKSSSRDKSRKNPQKQEKVAGERRKSASSKSSRSKPKTADAAHPSSDGGTIKNASRSEASGSSNNSELGSATADGDDERLAKNHDGSHEKSKRDNDANTTSKTKPVKAETPSAKLLHLRHKLQKLTLKEHIEDMGKIDALFTEVEKFDINIELLKESKIGKLMKKIHSLHLEDDRHNIKYRSGELIKKWKILLTSLPPATTASANSVSNAAVENSTNNSSVTHKINDESPQTSREQQSIEQPSTTIDESLRTSTLESDNKEQQEQPPMEDESLLNTPLDNNNKAQPPTPPEESSLINKQPQQQQEVQTITTAIVKDIITEINQDDQPMEEDSEHNDNNGIDPMEGVVLSASTTNNDEKP